MKTNINKLLISSTLNIKDALQVINENGLSACFIVDKDSSKMIGIVTDGDIRRAILRNVDLFSSIMEISNRKFHYASIGDTSEKINSILSDNIKILPLLDSTGIPVDYATISHLRYLPIYEPSLHGNELSYLNECIKTGWISSQGRFVKEFENKFKEFINVPYALSTSNGTTALHLALVVLGIGPGDEVIVPDFTFVASINSIIYTGATPVLIDVNKDTFNIDTSLIEDKITHRTKAIMPVHLYGNPCDMDEILLIAKKYNLKVIEDAAEAFGSEFKGIKTGAFGDIGCFSFFGNKTITTGEGGMMVFKNEELFIKAKILRDHGMLPEKKYWHAYVGYNYRMTNMQAAIGVAQLERAKEIIEKKIQIGKGYRRELCKNILGIRLVKENTNSVNTYWLFSLVIESELGWNKGKIQQKLQDNGIETRNLFYPLHVMPPYNKYIKKDDKFHVTEYLSENGFSLPSSTFINDDNIKEIARIFSETYQMNTILK
ncbi:MAG: aminotransferase class I/II-fold pyridoxal phosphate-dependent enzyme [Ignavibacteriaceae bacterium]|nr:aminotransferase class I/II-fold pyridoxal phosphate-dependent enzyme [Ignavibacteriaceae bacterium]